MGRSPSSEGLSFEKLKISEVGGELLTQVEEFKYLGVLFTSEGRTECEIDRWIGAAAAVMRSLYWSVVVKRELSRMSKLSIYRSIYGNPGRAGGSVRGEGDFPHGSRGQLPDSCCDPALDKRKKRKKMDGWIKISEKR